MLQKWHRIVKRISKGVKKINAADLLDVQKTLILPILNHELHNDGQSNSQGINQTAASLTRKNRDALLARMYISMDTLNLNTWIIMSITIFNPQFSLSSICLSHSLSFSASQSALPHLHLSLCCAEYRTYSISVEVSAFLLPFSSLFFFSVSANFPFPLSSFSLFPS